MGLFNYNCDGQISMFDYINQQDTDKQKSYPCSDCLLYDSKMSCGVNPLKEFCKKHVTKYDLCKDADINQIVFKLQNICANQRMQLENPKYEIWTHCPSLGYRMSMSAYYGPNTMPIDGIWDRLDEIVNFAKSKNIELSIIHTPYFGPREEITKSLWFSTLYLDNRKKIKDERMLIRC